MIKEILDADKRTRNAVESTEQLKLESSKRINVLLEKRRSEYIDKARMNIKVIRKIEESKADVKIKKIREDCERTLKRIDDVYLELKESWVETIFNNIVESQYD